MTTERNKSSNEFYAVLNVLNIISVVHVTPTPNYAMLHVHLNDIEIKKLFLKTFQMYNLVTHFLYLSLMITYEVLICAGSFLSFVHNLLRRQSKQEVL